MYIYFYKNLEFTNLHAYNIANGQQKGTFYVEILNQLDNILNWLENLLNITESNKTNRLKYPRRLSYKKLNPTFAKIIKLIEENIDDSLSEDKHRLENLTKYYDNLINDDFYKKKSKEYIEKRKTSIKELIESKNHDIVDKKHILFMLKSYINFLKMHKNKVDYFILKELKFKDNIPHNQINSFFSSKIELPPCTKVLIYEDNGILKRIHSIYSDSAELPEEERRNKIIDFFENQNFDYHAKYTIPNISELMNLYFNEFIDNKIPLKKCKNCGKYFIPNNKQIYCDNPSPQNENKTCRLLSNDIKANSDKIYEAYRKTYKTQHNKLKRYIDIGNISEKNLKERFKKWNEIALSKKNECNTIEEYNNWYQTSLNWIEDFK